MLPLLRRFLMGPIELPLRGRRIIRFYWPWTPRPPRIAPIFARWRALGQPIVVGRGGPSGGAPAGIVDLAVEGRVVGRGGGTSFEVPAEWLSFDPSAISLTDQGHGDEDPHPLQSPIIVDAEVRNVSLEDMLAVIEREVGGERER